MYVLYERLEIQLDYETQFSAPSAYYTSTYYITDKPIIQCPNIGGYLLLHLTAHRGITVIIHT